MNSSSLMTWLLAGALAACAEGQGEAGAGAAPAQPGAQGGQAPVPAQGASAGAGQGASQAGAATAQGQGQPQPQPDIQAGQRLAANGAPNGITACVTCHGAQGEGNAAAGFPRIAGQSAYYLGKQLLSYANGARVNPIMAPIAKAMNAQQVRDVSAYYANIGATAAGAPGTPAAGSGRGRAQQLATVGDNAVRVQACTNCHGPGGAGEPPIYPYLAGQHPSYLTAAMQAWKSGARKTDSSGQMPQIARALSDADVAALSDWFAAQPAPLQPAAKMTNIPAGSTLKPTVAAAAGAPGPSSGAAAGVTGSGTEQGAPVTGGGQGPGGGGGTQGTQPPAPPVKR